MNATQRIALFVCSGGYPGDVVEFAFTEYRVPIEFRKFREPIYLIPFGDVHRYAPNCDEEAWLSFLKYCKKIQKKYKTFYLGMGDYDDFMSTSERHAVVASRLHDTTIQTLDDVAYKRTYDLIEELKFMKGHILGLIEGNHHYKFSSGITSTQKMCEYFNCKHLGINTWLRLSFSNPHHPGRKMSLDIFAHHGRGGGRRMGGSINHVEDMMRVAEADIYIMGDDHKRWVAPVSRFIASHGNETFNVRERNIYLARSGSFQKGYIHNINSYITRTSLPPVNLGGIALKLTPVCKSKTIDGVKKEHSFVDITAEI